MASRSNFILIYMKNLDTKTVVWCMCRNTVVFLFAMLKLGIAAVNVHNSPFFTTTKIIDKVRI